MTDVAEREDSFVDDALLTEFYTMIGRIVVGWAGIENTLDKCLVIARSKVGRQTKSKGRETIVSIIDDLRKLLDTPVLSKHKQVADPIFLEAREVAIMRNLIIHGHWMGINVGPPLAAQITTRAHSYTNKAERDASVTKDDLTRLTNSMKKLDASLPLVLIALATSIPNPLSS